LCAAIITAAALALRTGGPASNPDEIGVGAEAAGTAAVVPIGTVADIGAAKFICTAATAGVGVATALNPGIATGAIGSIGAATASGAAAIATP
jgi:hypothetical protein